MSANKKSVAETVEKFLSSLRQSPPSSAVELEQSKATLCDDLDRLKSEIDDCRNRLESEALDLPEAEYEELRMRLYSLEQAYERGCNVEKALNAKIEDAKSREIILWRDKTMDARREIIASIVGEYRKASELTMELSNIMVNVDDKRGKLQEIDDKLIEAGFDPAKSGETLNDLIQRSAKAKYHRKDPLEPIRVSLMHLNQPAFSTLADWGNIKVVK